MLPNPPPPVVVVVLFLLLLLLRLVVVVLFLLLGDGDDLLGDGGDLLGDGVNLLGDRGDLFFVMVAISLVMVVDCNATTLVIMVDWVPFDSSSKKYVTNRPINQPT